MKIKKILLGIIILMYCQISFAQNGINYKAIVKDGSGNILASSPVSIQFIIYEGVALSNNVYQESHTTNTDSNGLVIVNIGEGTTADVFADINWDNDEHYLNVQINTGTGLVDIGTTQFKSVPYAITSGDKSWDNGVDNVNVLSKNVGIGTITPIERLQINDEDNAGIALVVPSLENTSKIEFKNGVESSFHSFYKIENKSDVLGFQLATDVTGTPVGYENKMTLNNAGLALEIGNRINEFSSDGTFTGNSNVTVPTERAVKTYVDNRVDAAVEKTILIPAATFIGNQNITSILYRNYGAYTQRSNGDEFLVAPLIVPQGATITSMTFYLRDESNLGNVNLQCNVFSGSQASEVFSSQFSVSTFGGSPSGTTLSYNTPFVIGINRRYVIRVIPTSTWGPNDFGICSVKVTYTD